MSDFEDDDRCTSPELCEKNEKDDLLPGKSRSLYETSFTRFLTWQKTQDTSSFSQKVVLDYFTDLSTKWKSSTLWSEFSKLSKMLKIKENVDIGRYHELKAFLQKKSIGYRPQKSKTLTWKDVERYVDEAPDDTYLATKVAMIFGVLGSCRKDDLVKIELSHLHTYYETDDTGKKHPLLLVRLSDKKTHIGREFTIRGKYYEFYHRYRVLRPKNTPHKRFFLTYLKGKCTSQPIGEKKFRSMPREVAKFLKLSESERYTITHGSRPILSTYSTENGDNNTRHSSSSGKLNPIAEDYIDASIFIKKEIDDEKMTTENMDESSNEMESNDWDANSATEESHDEPMSFLQKKVNNDDDGKTISINLDGSSKEIGSFDKSVVIQKNVNDEKTISIHVDRLSNKTNVSVKNLPCTVEKHSDEPSTSKNSTNDTTSEHPFPCNCKRVIFNVSNCSSCNFVFYCKCHSPCS